MKKSCLWFLCCFFLAFLFLPLWANEIPDLPTFPLEDESKRINDDTGTAVQERPAMAMNRYGNLVICWADDRGGNRDIYIQIFSAGGFPVKTNFRINDDIGTSNQTQPDVAIDARGRFVVVWQDERNGNRDIYAQLFEFSGQAIGTNFKVNDDVTAENQENPTVAMDYYGNFVVCWTDKRDGRGFYLYAQRFDRKGNRLGENFQVSSENSFLQIWPHVSMNDDGKFVIVWVDSRTSAIYDVCAQRFDEDGNRLGARIHVSEHENQETWTWFPRVAIQKDGAFGVFWSYALKDDFHNVFGRVYDADGNPTGNLFQINDDRVKTNNQSPDVCLDPQSNFLVIWSRTEDMKRQVYMVPVERTGSFMLAPSKIMADGSQRNPVIVMDNRLNMIVAWEDNRNDNSDIYATVNCPQMPLNVVAGSGFNAMVPLSWERAYGNNEDFKFNVYRCTTPKGEYQKVASLDFSDFGPLKAQMLDWIDLDVTNGTTYYYKVDIEGKAHSMTKEVPATPSAPGHQLFANWCFNPPQIDGVIELNEWKGAAHLNIASPQAFKRIMFYCQNDAQYLYLAAVDPSDDILNAHNTFGIIFDIDNNDVWDPERPGKEGVITINNTSTYFTGYWGTYPDKLGADIPVKPEGITSAISATNGYVQYEIAIDLTTSPLKAMPGQTIGAAMFIDDPGNYYPSNYGHVAQWPYGVLWQCALPLGDLSLAVPQDTTTSYDWPMASQCKERTSWAKAEETLEPPFQYTFEYPLGDRTATTLSYYNNMLCVGTIQEDAPHKLYAFTENSPTPQWTFELANSSGKFVATPAVNDKKVFWCGKDADGLYALNRENGEQMWCYEAEPMVFQNPILDDERLYFITNDFLCLNSGDGEIIWSQNIPNIIGSPAVDYTNVYFFGFEELFALEKLGGDMRWHLPNSNIFLAVDDHFIYTMADTGIIAQNKINGQVQWKYRPPTGIMIIGANNIAIDDQYICFTFHATLEEGKGILITLDKATGNEHWQHTFNKSGVSAPTIANGVVYVVDFISTENLNSGLWGFHLATGNVLFFDNSEDYQGQPIVANHTLFAGAQGKVKSFRNLPTSVADRHENPRPETFRLEQNYPNPFNPITTIRFHLPNTQKVRLVLLNNLGQEVREITAGTLTGGAHAIQVKLAGLPSGIYFYRLEAGEWVAMRKMLLLK